MDSRGWGGGLVSPFFVKDFFSCSAGKIGRETLLCCVSESFRQRISLCKRGGGRPKLW